MVKVRRARWQDLVFVRRVRNESDSRRWSVNGGRVGFLRHFAWWHGRSRSSENVYIVWIDGRRCGYVRVKCTSGNFGEMSVGLKKAARGQGAGSEAIRQSVRATAAIPGLMGWRARIDERNFSSIRAFVAAGFSPLPGGKNDTESFLTFERRNWSAL